MHGMINRALQGFLTAHYGARLWEEVRDIAGVDPEGFEAMLHYPDAQTTSCFDAACHVLNRHPNALLEDLGTYLVTHPVLEPLRRLLRFGGANFVDFLLSLEELPERGELAIPDLELPKIEVRECDPSNFDIRARWALPGIAPILLRAARLAAETQALTDPLTGLANRRAMDAELARLLYDPTAEFALLHIDLDLFKQVNDTLGHAAGDRVLQEVGRILSDEMRRADRAARVGGDEFLAIMRDCTEAEQLAAVCQRFIARIEEPVPFEGAQCRISASIGVATTAQYDTRPAPEEMLADTDMALYRAKRGGRGRFALHGVADAIEDASDQRRRG